MSENDPSNGFRWLCFMAHIPHSECGNIIKYLDAYKYIFGMETSDYEHFHFLVKMTEKEYYNFSKRVFKDKYKLRGRATNGAPRQYGKLKQINDIQKIARYTCKDKNVRTNLTDLELDDILGQKLEDCKNIKTESMDNFKKCCRYVENVLGLFQNKKYDDSQFQLVECDGNNHKLEQGVYFNADKIKPIDIKVYIIKWMIHEKMTIRKTTIESFYLYIISQSEHLKKNPYEIYNYLYNHEY